MNRQALAARLGDRITVTAAFQRYGKRPHPVRGMSISLCFEDIRDMKGALLTDHLWIRGNLHWKKLDLQPGDVVQFDAVVIQYERAWIGTNRKPSYGLRWPRRQKKIS